MMNSLNPYRLPADYPSPREILREHFPNTANELLIKGGWGYEMKDATIVLEFDPEINPDQRFDGISIENVFIQKRIWEELTFARPEGERFCGIRERKSGQSLHMDSAGTPYDRILVEVSAFREQDWEELKADWESHNGYQNDPEGKARHLSLRAEKEIHFQEEFWFNIENFY